MKTNTVLPDLTSSLHAAGHWLTENAGCDSENDEPSKLQGMKLADQCAGHEITRQEIAGCENAGHENAAHQN